MTEWLRISILPLMLTLLCYQVGLLLQKKLRTALLNPILLAVILILAFLFLTGMPNADYQAGMKILSWLLTPATVCLAIPMYQQFSVLKKNLPAIIAGIAAGAVACLAFVLGWGVLFGMDKALLISLLPKSVTSAIGVPLAEMAGGLAPVTTAVIIITGILGNLIGPLLCRLFRLKDETAQGVAFGTAAHVVGTAKANELSPLTGAVSSLSLVVAGLLTSAIFPLLIKLL